MITKKIKVVVVDDDTMMHEILHEFYDDSLLIEIKHDFTDPRKFIEAAPMLDFDLCFLDVNMPGMDGIVIGQIMKHKPIIYITGSDDRLRDALGLEPLDIVTKPFTKIRLDHAIERAHDLLTKKIDHAVFSVAESQKKVKINLSDILYVSTDDVDPRHKPIVLKDGTRYTLMNCTMDNLVLLAPHLLQVNKREMVAIDIIGEMQHDSISLKACNAASMPKEITLSRAFKSEVAKRIFFV